MQTKRRAPMWLIEENKKIKEMDERRSNERLYSSGCSDVRKAICKTFWGVDWYKPTCKDYDSKSCSLM